MDMMGSENMTVAPHVIGGGYGGYGYGNCGYGGGFGGVAGSAGIGGFLGAILGNGGFGFGGRRDGFDGGRGFERGNGVATDIILDDAHYNSLTNNIGQVKAEVGAVGNSIKAEVGNKFDHFTTKFNDFELAWCQANGATNANIANGTYQGALNTKDIIHDLDTKICATNRNIDQTKWELSKQLSDCCCEQKMLTMASTQKILDQLCIDEKQELRDRLNRMERDNDLFRISTAIRTTAVTNGSNFNTGTQTSQNNSGQLIGA